MKHPRLHNFLRDASRWFIAICLIAALGYAIPKVFINNGIAQVAHTPEEKYYAEKVLEYRKKYLVEHGFALPLQLHIDNREIIKEPKELLRKDPYHCKAIPEAHFNELYDKVYRYQYNLTGFSWFGLQDSNAGGFVMGCALYKVGV